MANELSPNEILARQFLQGTPPTNQKQVTPKDQALSPAEIRAREFLQGTPIDDEGDRALTVEELPDIIQEQHPQIGTVERAGIKWFTNSPEGGAQYLKKNHPEMDFRVVDDQILARAPDEKAYRVLDPKMGVGGMGEFGKDVLDLGYDFTGGLAQGAATVFGAAGGIPGAALASGVSGAAIEALRQRIGQQLGMNQDINTGDVTSAGVIGAVIPGAGKLIGKALPYVGEKLSGISRETIKDLAGVGLGRLKDMEKGGLLTPVRDVQEKVLGQIDETYKAVSNSIKGMVTKYSPVIKGQFQLVDGKKVPVMNTGVDISGAENAFWNKINELYDTTRPGQKEAADKVIETANRLFARENPAMKQREKALVEYGKKLKQFKKEGEHEITPQELKYTKTIPEIPSETIESAKYKIISSKAIPEKPSSIESLHPEWDLKDAWDLRQDLRLLSEFNPMQLSEFAKMARVKPQDAQKLQAAAREAYAAVNASVDNAFGRIAGSTKFPTLREDFMLNKGIEEAIYKKFKDVDATTRTLQTLAKKGVTGQVQREQLRELTKRAQELASRHGVETKIPDLERTAQDLVNYQLFSGGALDPISSGGVTSTSRTIPSKGLFSGLAASAALGQGYGYPGAVAAGEIGGLIGTSIGSPAAIRKMIEAGNASKNIWSKIGFKPSRLAGEYQIPGTRIAIPIPTGYATTTQALGEVQRNK